MDERTRNRLFVGFITTWISKLASSIIQFVQIPILFHYWTIQMNGEWMILSAIPSYLSFSNIGFGSVAGNEMTMLMARGEQDAALSVFQSCWWLISLVLGVLGIAMCAALYFLPVADLLHLSSIGNTDARGSFSGWGWPFFLASSNSYNSRRIGASRATPMATCSRLRFR